MSTFFSWLYIFWVFLVFTVFMLLFLPGIIIPAFFGQHAVAVTYFFMKAWSWVFSMLTFIRYDMIGRENIVPGKAYIYVSNHTSFLDLPGIAMTIRGQFRPLAKKELLKLPVFGWITRATCVVVDRSNNESRKKSLERLKEILNMGINILVFPEGTQNRTKELLQPFKDGAFRIAADTQKPLLPMVVLGAAKLMPPGTIRMRPGRIKIIVGPEIAVGADEDTRQLKEKNFHDIRAHDEAIEMLYL
ncbi:MAG: 1-acylglycerol-3-phosphate O-acyltransferase [Bacteroidetes bacterium OLB12]|nr:MAG: 1-acylglycerol-3-phosphate O-acyltransferase [Bacteroidetes bacterium OLB12]